MPLIDKPLSELQNYRGINPKPADFDDYWARALRELDATDPKPELIPNSSITGEYFECFDLWFTGVGGARIYAKYLRPKTKTPHPAILQFHGYTGSSGDWVDKLPYVASGYSVASLDCRGQGGKSEDPGGAKGTTHHGHIIRGLDDHPDKLLFRQLFLDTAQLARVVMSFPEVDASRVGAMGGSQGGGLVLACAALEPRLKRIVSLHPFLSDYQRVWEMDLDKDAYGELREYFRMFDPRHEREEEIFHRLGYIDVHHLAPRITTKTLFALGLMDTITPPSTVFAAYNNLTCPKEIVLYPDFGHEVLPGFNDRAFAFLGDL